MTAKIKMYLAFCFVLILAASVPRAAQVSTVSAEVPEQLDEVETPDADATGEELQIPSQEPYDEPVELLAEDLPEEYPEEETPPMPELVLYEGMVEHIFFHPLVLYPELAFNGNRMSAGYDDWFVTVGEFKKILQSIYENGYVLVDINSLVELGEDGVMSRRELFLPEGRKPLVLSVDDLNYYEYMRKYGNNYKLILNGEGVLATYAVSPDGIEEILYDAEVVTIVDSFVRAHPDFSHNGAKGVLALTGYEGVLGYQTHLLNSEDYETEKQAAERVVEKLKQNGWTFASHSYYHRQTGKIPYAQFADDTARWKKEVEIIVGGTAVYIYPFGSSINSADKKFSLMLDSGFNIVCGVGTKVYNKLYPNYFFMDRCNIDGYNMRNRPQSLQRFFETEQVLDRVARRK